MKKFVVIVFVNGNDEERTVLREIKGPDFHVQISDLLKRILNSNYRQDYFEYDWINFFYKKTLIAWYSFKRGLEYSENFDFAFKI